MHMDQTELTPALERVAASVVETHRKRQQVEEELKAAAAAVASLHSQSSALEASIVALRGELEQAVALKSQDDATLQELADKQRSAIERLATVARDVETALADQHRVAASIASQTEAAWTQVRAVQGEVATVKTSLSTLSGDASSLKTRLGELVKAADGVSGQVTEIESKARELDTAVDGIAAKVCVVADRLEKADRQRQAITETSEELKKTSAALEARRADVQDANRETDALLEARALQTSSLSREIERLAQLNLATAPSTATQNSATTPQAPSDANRAYEAHREAMAARPDGHVTTLTQTKELVQLLATLTFMSRDEGGMTLDLIAENDVDKVVRSLWSRAMGGPHPTPYRLIIGSALAESGDHKGAVTFFNKALEGRNVDPMMTYLVALALLRMRRYVDVLRLAQALSKTKNGKALGRNIEGLHLAASGRMQEAEAKLAEALTLPAQPRMHYSESMYNLAQLAKARGADDVAVTWLERLAVSDPGYRDPAAHMEPSHVGAHPV